MCLDSGAENKPQSINARSCVYTFRSCIFCSGVRHCFPGCHGPLQNEQKIKEHSGHCALLSSSSTQPITHLGQKTISDIESNVFWRRSLSQRSNCSFVRSLFSTYGGIESLHLVPGHTNWNTLPSLTCILHKVSIHFTQKKCSHGSLMKFEPDCFNIKVSCRRINSSVREIHVTG